MMYVLYNIVISQYHKDCLDINTVWEINDLLDDVAAHAAIIASPRGFTEGARNRCKEVNIFPMVLPSDLLAMIDETEVPWTTAASTTCALRIMAISTGGPTSMTLTLNWGRAATA